MNVRCPNCDRPVEYAPPEEGLDANDPSQTLSRVSCPQCGIVPIRPEGTVSFREIDEDRKDAAVGHFRLVRVLGQGGYGEVWLADDVSLGRQVALKLPKPHAADLTHLMFEARMAASLRHPHIVSIYEVGDEGGQVFIASEFIDGLTLRDLMSAGKPTIDRTLEILTVVSRALHYAHQQRVVHRDIKPSNILLSKEGQPYVNDFGIAKRISADETIANEGEVLGTARYMSPEQAAGRTRETDHRSDIYALGVVLFEMLTGDVPFRGNIRAILFQKVSEDAPSLRTLDRSLPKDLETVCMKCLEREPDKRYATALELAEELERFAAGEPIRARPITPLERTWRWCRRRPTVAGLLAALFLSLTLGLAGVTYFWRDAERNVAVARQSLYRSWMNLAAVHLNHGDAAGVKEMLARIATDPQMARLRGFEWNYYDAVTAPLTLVANTGDVVSDVAVSRDGAFCATIGRESEIRVWDAASGELVRTLAAEAEKFQSIDFSPTNLSLVAGAADGYLRLWNPLQSDRLSWQVEHGPPVVLVRFSPDGKRVLSAGQAGAVRLWDANDGTLVAEIPTGRTSDTKDVRFTDGGKFLVVAMKSGRIRVWDVSRSQLAKEPDWQFDANPQLERIAISDDGQLLAVGDFHGTLSTGLLRGGSLTSHSSIWGRIDDLEFLPGTHLVVAVSNDGQSHFFDVDVRGELRSLNTHSLMEGCLARSVNGKFLAIGSGDGTVTRLKLEGLSIPSILWHSKAVRDVAFLADNRRLVSLSDDGLLWLWDTRTGKSQSFDLAARTISVQSGGSLVATAGIQPVVKLWDADSQKIVYELPTADTGAAAVQFSTSGKELAIVDRAGDLQLRSAPDWKERGKWTGRPAKANALAFTSDDRLVAVAWEDAHVSLFDTVGNRWRETLISLKAEATAVAFCEADRLLAIGTGTGEIHLWSISTREYRTVIKGHTGRINTLATDRGGNTLYSGGRDRDLKLWDVHSGELITALTGHRRQVFTLAISPDGETVASGSLEGDVRVWVGKH